jgi:glycosyltransferase involved in cell wall biosynthesis
MKKVLFITYYWPPSGGPGVQRALKFSRYLSDFGWIPVVLTVRDGDYPAVDKSLMSTAPDLKVIHTSSIEPFRLYRSFTGKNQNDAIPTFVLNRDKTERFSDRLSKWIRANLFIPDGRVGWVPFAVKKGLEIIRSENIRLVFSTSPPHSLQLAAWFLAKKANLPWITDFRDPWTEAFWVSRRLNKISKGLNQRIESTVFKNAAFITTVSPGLSKLFYDKHNRRSEVIYNGFEQIHTGRVRSETFMILFIGHLSSFQNPEPLFRSIMQMPKKQTNKIMVRFIGQIFQEFQPLFRQYPEIKIDVIDYLPYDQLMEKARLASMLFRPVAKSEYASANIGTKMFDYLSLRKPILTIGPRNSVSEMILKETESGQIFDETEIKAMGEYISKYFALWEKEGTILLNNMSRLQKYSTKHSVKKLANLFNQVDEYV